MLAGNGGDLCHFGFSNVKGINPTNAYAILVNIQHYRDRLVAGFMENLFQYIDDKFHRGVIVIKQQNPVHRRTPRSRAGLFNHADLWTIILMILGAIIFAARYNVFSFAHIHNPLSSKHNAKPINKIGSL